MDAAAHWQGILPSQLGICKPEEDRYYIMAHYSVTGKMQAVEQEEMEREAARKDHKTKGSL